MKLGFIANNDLEGLERDAQFASEYGYKGLEFNWWGNFKDVTAEQIEQMREILERYGVQAASFGIWGWNHIAADDTEREEAHRQLDRAIEFAQALGADVLITGGGHREGLNTEQSADLFAETMKTYLDKAEAAGLKVVLYGFHGGSFLASQEAYEAVWERVPSVGIKYDPANIDHAGLDYLKIAREHADKIGHVHIKEHLNHDGEVASQPAAGMGDIAFGKVMAFLYEADYQGWLIVEPHGPKWGREPLRRVMLVLTKRYMGQFLV